jgi:hypothetical protein
VTAHGVAEHGVAEHSRSILQTVQATINPKTKVTMA